MKVLGLSGSPRPDGNTSILLDRFLAGAVAGQAQAKRINLAGLNISACTHCDACTQNGVCTIDDDMSAVYAEIEKADVLVLASPLQFMTVTADMKAAIDRCQVYWARKYVLGTPPLAGDRKRRGVFISVGGQKGRSIFDAARVTVKALFVSLDIEYSGELLFPGIDEKGAVVRHPAAMQQAFDMGTRLASSTG